ncbi:MAG: branched-chain amino acid ABC transporter permease [Candidatus Rokubacteria bacterium]|nr:branched-chain amino acid ABC transporter permease [Candidatus Rokubacteria bacterium]
MHVALQIFFDALLLVGIYAIGALGFALIWGVLNLLNLAHGAFIMLGAYSTFLLWRAGLDPLLALPVTMAVMFAFGWLLQRYVFDFMVNGPPSQSIALTFGVNLVLMGVALRVFTGEYRSIVVPPYLQGFVDIGGARLTYARIATIVIALGLTAALWWFMDHTEKGQAIRATRLDLDAARLVGVDVQQIYSLTTAISAAMAGAAGGLIALVYSVSPQMADSYLMQIFIVTVLGGLGSMVGPLLGAAVVGVTNSAVASLVGATYSSLVGAGIVLLILVVRPGGLLGRRFYEG